MTPIYNRMKRIVPISKEPSIRKLLQQVNMVFK